MALSARASGVHAQRIQPDFAHFVVEDFRQFASQPSGAGHISTACRWLVAARQIVMEMDLGYYLNLIHTHMISVCLQFDTCHYPF
jgi:hypothetical protein